MQDLYIDVIAKVAKEDNMKSSELTKLLGQKGLTPEQVAKIIERYEKQKERTKQYQKQKYAKVSVSVRKEEIERIATATGVDKDYVKKYLAAEKLLKSIPSEILQMFRKL